MKRVYIVITILVLVMIAWVLFFVYFQDIIEYIMG
jgi:hypothetical protein